MSKEDFINESKKISNTLYSYKELLWEFFGTTDRMDLILSNIDSTINEIREDIKLIEKYDNELEKEEKR